MKKLLAAAALAATMAMPVSAATYQCSEGNITDQGVFTNTNGESWDIVDFKFEDSNYTFGIDLFFMTMLYSVSEDGKTAWWGSETDKRPMACTKI